MPDTKLPKRLGFFTRLLDDAEPGERYRLAAEQIVHAEANGFDTAWVAQHHFHRDEGGLPSPFVLLSHVAARTSRIRLGTGVITLPLEQPIRAAEDAAVLDLLSGGRLEIGLGTGGTPSSFTAFGHDSAERGVRSSGSTSTSSARRWPARRSSATSGSIPPRHTCWSGCGRPHSRWPAAQGPASRATA